MDLRGGALGLIAALRNLDSEAVTLITRFVMRAVKSGNTTGYIKRHLQSALDEEDRLDYERREAARRPTVTTKPVR